MPLRDAIDRAIDECIEKNILASVLSKHRREVKDMVLTEFDQNKYGEICKAEGKAEGIEIGKAQGIEIGKNQGIEIGKNQGKTEILNQQKTELINLVHTGELSISVAAKLLHISEEEFSKLLK